MRKQIDHLCTDRPLEDFRDFVSELLNKYRRMNDYKGRHWPAEAAVAVLQHRQKMEEDAEGGQKPYLLQKGGDRKAQIPDGGYYKILWTLINYVQSFRP